MPRIIGHLDMDAFFAAIEERDTPRFRGFPIVVGADPRGGHGRGVVSTANYPARAYGIRSALPISTAWRLAESARRQGHPPVLFLPGNFRRYEEASQRIMSLIRHAVPLVQQRSVDEAYLDLSFTGSIRRARELCQQLKDEIRTRERLTASVGIGPNKLIAKIASDMEKPDGLTVVEKRNLATFLAPLPVRVIPGVGPKTEAVLLQKGVRLVSDLQRRSRHELHDLFGMWGLALYEKVRGQDESPIQKAHVVKSVGAQTTFPVDTLDSAFIVGQLMVLAERVLRHLSRDGFRSFRTVVLTVRFANFQTTSRASTAPQPLTTLRELQHRALQSLLPFLDARENPRHEPLRLIGVRVEKLE